MVEFHVVGECVDAPYFSHGLAMGYIKKQLMCRIKGIKKASVAVDKYGKNLYTQIRIVYTNGYKQLVSFYVSYQDFKYPDLILEQIIETIATDYIAAASAHR